SSYRTKTPAPVGSLGPGWKMPADIRLQLRDNTLILSDNGGRSLYFEHLFPGEDGYSRSESLWLVRGGVAKLDEGHRLAALWQALPEELRLSPHRYLATNSPQGPWWLLGWCERVPEADEVLPAPLPPYRVLTGLVDRFGRTQTFHREAAGEFSGEITGVTDGAGRHFRLVLTTQAQRAEEARQQAISGGTEPSAFPDTLPGYTEYGRDNGIRLSAVWLTHDPEYPENLPAAPLVRYGWTPRGELAVVYDRSGKQVRSFTYDDKYRGRMVAHRHTGRPEIRYRYDSDGRVTEQLNPAGLSYTYQYEKDRITITDSLDRREVLHTQGEAGLKRVVKKEHADGSVTQSQFDAVGRLKAQTDAAGRTTEYSPDVVTGLTTPDGRASAFYYNHHNQLTSATGPDGLEMRRKYDESGRLIQETAPDGDITRYRYDNPHSDLPCATEDATGSRKTMTWSRYGQLLTFTDCSGYVTRYDHDRFGQVSLSRKPQVTWYGWDGDRLTTIQNDRSRIQTIYQPGSFTPLIRVETATGEQAKTQRRSLADTLQQSGGEDGGSVVFPPVLVQMLDRLESEILADRVSEESRRWLASCGLTVEQMQNQMDPVYTPARKIHLYHCDHRGLPLALISTEGATAWCAEYDEWGNLLNEENPHQLQQLIRLPGQQYDEESGLYYNRHRYYDPLQGRYITQDPIGLKGGWNFYQYPLNPISNIDPLGLETLKCIKPLHSMGGTGERSGPDIWGNPFYHQYLCVPDGKGDYTCGGQDQRGESKGDGLWGPGKASNDTKEAAGRCDLVETDNSCVENCLKGKFKEVRPRYSVLPDIFTPINLGLFKNCQDWSNDSLETCKMKCSGNNIGRFIRFVFTGVM
ncbi:RHS repeat protein, partial [Escherichia coli]|nr:RHS repeat protein [Escherichia coli]